MICAQVGLARYPIVWLVLSVLTLLSVCEGTSDAVNTADTDATESVNMSKEERHKLRDEARDMFYHAYRAYMDNAYPADELMPLSCAGRYRGLGTSRGDIDDALGNFSLTLIDTLDTLVVLGDLDEFESAVKLVIRDVSFDSDIVVSVFETNIRVLGGLLSAHILAEYLQGRAGVMSWYKGELLSMAKDLGYRMLPAFNTTTGIPYARVNLRHGLKGGRLETPGETCTACAGTIILEMATLSRLTGERVFEDKAQRAMDELWKMRHRSSDLMGTVLNVHSGDWIRRDSGVGAGIDSYYEYCLKAYILLGDDKYLTRFNRHYSAVMKYISQGPMLLDVHMHRPHTNSRNYMDALLAFWPGLQVLKGDIKPAVETHEMLYQVMQRHNFIPEAFTTDFQVHWGQHPLRPEFLESTYFLYTATGDPYYLQVGRSVLHSLQRYARVPCGYAAVNDVRTGKHEDRMDSFVLAETFKYLFLLFADPDDLVLDLDEFLFTTEAHLLPLTLAAYSNVSAASTTKTTKAANTLADEDADDSDYSRTCPSSLHLFPESVRKPLKNMVNLVCPRRPSKRKLTAFQFQPYNFNHLKLIKDMGINLIAMNDGRNQLLYSFSSAKTLPDAEEGLIFMQEMVELSKNQAQEQQDESLPPSVSFALKTDTAAETSEPSTEERRVYLKAGLSNFGPRLKGDVKVTSTVVFAVPIDACSDLYNGEQMVGKIVAMARGDCMFIEKSRRIQQAGAVGGIVIDNTPGSSYAKSALFAMWSDGKDDVVIPVVLLFSLEANRLLSTLWADTNTQVTLGEFRNTGADEDLMDFFGNAETENVEAEAGMFQRLKVSVKDFLLKHTAHMFGKTVTLGRLTATVTTEHIEIKRARPLNQEQEKETSGSNDDASNDANGQWSIVKVGRVTLMKNKRDHFLLSLSALDMYYNAFGLGDKLEGVDEPSTDSQMQKIHWLLGELSMDLEQEREQPITDNLHMQLMKLLPTSKQLVTQLLNYKSITSNVGLDKIHSVLESINQLEKTIQQLERRGTDDLVIGNHPNDKVLPSATNEQTRTSTATGGDDDEIITKQTVSSKDEL